MDQHPVPMHRRVPVKAPVESRMQLPWPLHARRILHNMIHLVGKLLGNAPQGQSHKAGGLRHRPSLPGSIPQGRHQRSSGSSSSSKSASVHVCMLSISQQETNADFGVCLLARITNEDMTASAPVPPPHLRANNRYVRNSQHRRSYGHVRLATDALDEARAKCSAYKT